MTLLWVYSPTMKWFLLSLLSFCAQAMARDKYPDFASLAQSEQDFRIESLDRNSPLSIFAIHGGLIEPGSDELARALAADKHNLYVFEGLKTENPFSLHITATRFDEPRALDLATKSKDCVSVHGYIGNGSKAICIGGNNKALAALIVTALQNSTFEVIYPCQAYPATHPKNIVNRCGNQGVQLEISQGLMDELKLNPVLKNELTTKLKSIF